MALRLVDQLGDQSIAVPQFHVMPVYELFGGFNRGDIFIAYVRMLLRLLSAIHPGGLGPASRS